MSTHQVSSPRAAKKSITEASARPPCRSKVGCEAIEEPCTNRIRPAGPDGSPAFLFHRNRRTSLPLLVQCSSPRMVAAGETGLFMLLLRILSLGQAFIDTRGRRHRAIAVARSCRISHRTAED